MLYSLLGVKRQINLIVDLLSTNICLQSGQAAMNISFLCSKLSLVLLMLSSTKDSRPLLLEGVFIFIYFYFVLFYFLKK